MIQIHPPPLPLHLICMSKKTTKLHEPGGRVQCVVFEKFTSAYLHQIAREIMLLLVNNLHEKRITERRTKFWQRASALFVIGTRVATFIRAT